MFQTLITRKNLIAISIAMFYSLVLLFTGLCLDAGSSFVVATNPIAQLSGAIGFQPISAGTSGFICVILIAVYVILMVAALAYERRYAIVNGIRLYSPKMVLSYTTTVIVCVLLSLGLGILIQKPINAENIGNLLTYVSASVVVSALIFLVLALAVGAVIMFVINLLNIDKPYKFFDDKDKPILQDEIEQNLDITNSFDMPEVDSSNAPVASSFAGGGGGEGGVFGGDGTGEVTIKDTELTGGSETVFPGLTRIDLEYDGFEIDTIDSVNISLSELAEGFRNYLAKDEKLYFDIDVIRFFISGFATSHFLILEGLSGTGKSSLPRYFAKYVNGRFLFMPVQTTWRDKTNILGFLNEFSKTYAETAFLEELYRANYNPDTINIFVLDEMNISRVEYYFADFLSVLEYPKDEWRLKVMQLPHDFIPPIKLDDGFVKIPENSYFVGTANKDDSTFTITDKVYDRAITIDFMDSNDAFDVAEETSKITLSYSKFKELYTAAIENPEYALTEEDSAKLRTIMDYASDRFDIAIGNRILNQINNIVPVFQACGGHKDDAIDFMLAKKLVFKVEGRFEEHIKDSLSGLIDLLYKTYGNGTMKRTVKTARAIMKSL